MLKTNEIYKLQVSLIRCPIPPGEEFLRVETFKGLRSHDRSSKIQQIFYGFLRKRMSEKFTLIRQRCGRKPVLNLQL